MLVCKNCPSFMENELYPTCNEIGLWPCVAHCDEDNMSRIAWKYRRRHSCHCDGVDWNPSKDEPLKEYYKLGVPSYCEYEFEHTMFDYSVGEHRDVDYGFTRHFKSKRVCQHCGRIIPNRKTCPTCGFKWFDSHPMPSMKKTALTVCIYVALFFSVMWSRMFRRD